MNNIWLKRLSALLIFSPVAILGSELSAQAQTLPTPGITSTTAADLKLCAN